MLTEYTYAAMVLIILLMVCRATHKEARYEGTAVEVQTVRLRLGAAQRRAAAMLPVLQESEVG